MSNYILDQRRRAMEEAFFAKQDGRLRQAVRRRYQHRAEKKSLMRSAGIFDEIVVEELLNLNISADTLVTLQLIPLIEVGWADQELDDHEREAIIGWARGEDGPDRPTHQLLETWLQSPLPNEVFEAWKDYASAVYTTLPAFARDSWKRHVIDSIKKVARASGGMRGFRKVSAEERKLIAEVEVEFERRRYILLNWPNKISRQATRSAPSPRRPRLLDRKATRAFASSGRELRGRRTQKPRTLKDSGFAV